MKEHTKILSSLVALLLVTVAVVAVAHDTSFSSSAVSDDDSTVPVSSVEFDREATTIYMGSNYTLNTTVLPEKATNKSLRYQVSSSKILSVSNSGVITPIANGVAYVRATAKDGSKKYDRMQITVETKLRQLSLNSVKRTMEIGGTYQLKWKLFPTTSGNSEVKFATSDSKIAKVNKSGNITAVSTGKCTVTCTSKAYPSLKSTCVVTVKSKLNTSKDTYSTAYVANNDILSKNKKSNSSKKLYYIKVNIKANCVTVYTYDSNGKYTVPVRAMVCSAGLGNNTPLGTYKVAYRWKWLRLHDVYGQYVTQWYGDYLFHSVPYSATQTNKLFDSMYNRLGTKASAGCIRLAVSDAKWIYNNIQSATTVKIYESSISGPLGKPVPIRTTKALGYDPTDSVKGNPYNSMKPTIKGATDVTILCKSGINLLSGVKAYDTCGNDITDRLVVSGYILTKKEGTYKITYSVKDVLNRTTTVTRVVTVE